MTGEGQRSSEGDIMYWAAVSRRGVAPMTTHPFPFFIFLSDTPVLSDLSFMRAMTVNCNDNEAVQEYRFILGWKLRRNGTIYR